MFRFFQILLLLTICHCSQRLIEKEKLREMNQYYDERVYQLKEDVKISQDEVWKKGTLVRLYVESTPSLLKIKIYPAKDSRENSTGKLASYLINDNVKKKKYGFSDVEEWVNSKFQVADPKSIKTKK
ncbi:MAG: type II secretion system-associated lipoprotein [Leptospira sp.]|nr:type II secretion system-associated lipoprotein [Leptospira sp.]